MARSNSAKAPTICIIIRPAGVVVSIASVKLRNPLLRLPELLHDREHVAQRAREPIQLPDNDHITGAKLIEEPEELGPVPTSAGSLLTKDALRSQPLSAPPLEPLCPDRPWKRGRNRST